MQYLVGVLLIISGTGCLYQSGKQNENKRVLHICGIGMIIAGTLVAVGIDIFFSIIGYK